MRQFAKLVFHEGRWYFRLDDDESSTRAWVDRDAALADLAEDGWKVKRPYPKGFSAAQRSRLGIFGYLLVKTI